MTDPVIIGIDPGVSTGAVAAISPDGDFRDVRDAPWLSSGQGGRKEPDLAGMTDVLGRFNVAHAFIELIRPFGGKQNSLSVHSLAASDMAWRALMHGNGHPVEQITPQVWRATLQCPVRKGATDTEKKHALLAKARGLFPDAPLELVKHDGRAAALLIAEAGRRLLAGAGSLPRRPGEPVG